MRFHRHARAAVARGPSVPLDPSPRALGGAAVLRADEVPRESVRLLVVDRRRDAMRLARCARLPQLLRAGDLLVVNDAATLPASLPGRTSRGEVFELRLSAPVDGSRLSGVAFGPGDHTTRTEDRPPPPPIATGDRVWIADFEAEVTTCAGRRLELVASLAGDRLWQALYGAGRPVQYAHRRDTLPLWAVQTAYAARPWSAEMPSAGRPLTWEVLLGLRRAGVSISHLTHAAGLSSTGDAELDRVMPWPERYEVPRRTIDAIVATRARGGRVVAVGTTVVRALESSALRAGSGVATLRIDERTPLRVVDGLLSGLHVPGESHFELLSAFVPRARLTRGLALAAAEGLSAHELGDACLIL